MALSQYRDSLANLLEVIDAQGGYLTPQHQRYVRTARDLLLREVESPVPMTAIRCNTDTCPSRLVLVGELNLDAASASARAVGWWTAEDLHLCPACRSD